MRRIRAFTLMELILVVIILGILVSLGAAQYTNLVEKSRYAEGIGNLGTLRTMELVYHQDHTNYGLVSDLGSPLPTAYPACTNTSYFFGYSCYSANGTCEAHRCTGGGKTPDYTGTSYVISLTPDGVLVKP